MMVVHMVSPDDTRDQQYISNYATLFVKDRLARIDGTADSHYRPWRDTTRICLAVVRSRFGA